MQMGDVKVPFCVWMASNKSAFSYRFKQKENAFSEEQVEIDFLIRKKREIS